MKKLLVVLDGIGDMPCRDLNGKTPLESARKPNLDYLASQSKTGCINIAGDIAPESGAESAASSAAGAMIR